MDFRRDPAEPTLRRLAQAQTRWNVFQKRKDELAESRRILREDKSDFPNWLVKHSQNLGDLFNDDAEIDDAEINEENLGKFTQLHRINTQTLRNWSSYINNHNSKVAQLEKQERSLQEEMAAAKETLEDLETRSLLAKEGELSPLKEDEKNELRQKINLLKENINVEIHSVMNKPTDNLFIQGGQVALNEKADLKAINFAMYDLSRKIINFKSNALMEFLNKNKAVLASLVPGYVIILGLIHLHAIFFSTNINFGYYTVIEDFLLVGTDFYVLITSLIAIAFFVLFHYLARRSTFQALNDLNDQIVQSNGNVGDSTTIVPYPVKMDRAIKGIGLRNWKLAIVIVPFAFSWALGAIKSPYVAVDCGENKVCHSVAGFIGAQTNENRGTDVDIYMTVNGANKTLINQRLFASLSNFVFATNVPEFKDNENSGFLRIISPPAKPNGDSDSHIWVLKKAEIDCFATGSNRDCISLAEADDQTDKSGDKEELPAPKATPNSEGLDDSELIAIEKALDDFKKTISQFDPEPKLGPLYGDYIKKTEAVVNNHVGEIALLTSAIQGLVQSSGFKDLPELKALLKERNRRDVEFADKMVNVFKGICEEQEGYIPGLLRKLLGGEQQNECVRNLVAYLRQHDLDYAADQIGSTE